MLDVFVMSLIVCGLIYFVPRRTYLDKGTQTVELPPIPKELPSPKSPSQIPLPLSPMSESSSSDFPFEIDFDETYLESD